MSRLMVGLVFMGVMSRLSFVISFNPWYFAGSFPITSGFLKFSPHQFVPSVIPTHPVFSHQPHISQNYVLLQVDTWLGGEM